MKNIEEPKQEISNEAKERAKNYMTLKNALEPKQETLEESAEIDLTKLCHYDKRNPDFQVKEEYGYDKEEVEATGNFSKKDCACDNCFYGRSKLTEQLIWQAERMYSEKEVLEMLNMSRKICSIDGNIDLDNDALQGDLEGFNMKYTISEIFEQFKKK